MLRNSIGQMLDVYVNNGVILNYEITNNKIEGRDIEIFMKNGFSLKIVKVNHSRLPLVKYTINNYIGVMEEISKTASNLMEVNSISLSPSNHLMLHGYQYDGTIITFEVYLPSMILSYMRVSYEVSRNPNLHIDAYSDDIYNEVSMIPTKNNVKVYSYCKPVNELNAFNATNLESKIDSYKKKLNKLIKDHIRNLETFIEA